MRPVSDAFLLLMAEVSSALIGLFLVGVFFYAESGFRRGTPDRELMDAYFRAGTRIVLVLYTIPLALSLTLVALEPAWSRWLFALLSLALIAANVDSARRLRTSKKVIRSTALVVNEAVGTAAVVTLVILPWALGGFHPTREDLTWAILLSFTSGFLSVCALVLFVLDVAGIETRPE